MRPDATLPLPQASDDRPEPDKQKPAVEPLLISADAAATVAGVSPATWWRLHAAGKVPAPVKLGGRTLWRAEELRRWVAAGCPDRRTWEATEAVRRRA